MTPTVTIGPHRLFMGDAYAIRPDLGWMDADIMDPPYAFNNSGGGGFRRARGASNQIVAERLDRGFDHAIIDPARSGAVVIFCHQDQIENLVPAITDHEAGDLDALLVADMFAALRPKFHRAALLMWVKPNPSPMANKHYLADIEPYIHAWNKGWHPQGAHHDKHRHISAGSVQSKTFGHPTVKPDAVMNKIVTNVAGETICDPFMGTGSTGVAAIRAGRIFTGIEHNPQHFETAVRRCTAAYQECAAA